MPVRWLSRLAPSTTPSFVALTQPCQRINGAERTEQRGDCGGNLQAPMRPANRRDAGRIPYRLFGSALVSQSIMAQNKRAQKEAVESRWVFTVMTNSLEERWIGWEDRRLGGLRCRIKAFDLGDQPIRFPSVSSA